MEKKPFNFPCSSKPPAQKALTNPKVKSFTLIEGNRASQGPSSISPQNRKEHSNEAITKSLYSKSRASLDESVENMDFLGRKEYIEKNTCNICSKDFSSLLSQTMKKKHCKICGYTVCGDCSQERVKDRRACDLCVWRLRNKPGEDLREEFLVNYEEAVKELEIELQTMEAKIDELKNLTLSLNTETENEKNQAIKILKELDQELDKNKAVEADRRETFEKLSNEFKNMTEELKTLRTEFTNKETENRAKKAEIEKKKGLYEEKTGVFKKVQEELRRFVG